MHYYQIYLPLALTREFHFTGPEGIREGARVLVSFNRQDIIGICGRGQVQAPVPGIAYKPVLEVLDDEPVLSAELLELSRWMADYYHCSIGSACFAMLPAWLIPDIEAELSWLGEEIPGRYAELASALAGGVAKRVSELRKVLRGKPVLRLVEEAVNEGYLLLSRKLSSRDKPKTVNILRLLRQDTEFDGLPPRQKEAMQIIIALTADEVPMARLTSLISYSAIKGLVKKGWLAIEPRKVEREFFHYDGAAGPREITLNSEQEQAVAEILASQGEFRVHLLYGITGSGKTEVYIRLIRDCLERGRNVIFLIPEIALTPQMVERFQGEFGSIMAISHSQLSDRQRLKHWQQIRRGECRIVIGARSAVFSPLPDLGLVIVDEEHEQSYKQDNVPRYNGRDLAVMRARLAQAQVVLGSATPSLESWNNQQQGKYSLHCLVSRPLEIKLPTVRILNLCEEQTQELLTVELVQAIGLRLERGEQVILFQNRRGFSSFVQCLKCGELIKCPNCEISMYYHRDREEMQCHYCGYSTISPRKCPSCGGYSFSYGSPGTQKIEQLLEICFPQAKLLRLDSDSARQRDSHKEMYRRMKSREVDILLGTQMISKGLDFPNVTLVGIINADISLNIPDFRSAERTFQLCTQVAGRAGRSDKTGEVIIQTHNPTHYAIAHAGNQDFRGFAEEEMSYRQRLNYPPYFRLARILYQARNGKLLSRAMEDLATKIIRVGERHPPGEAILLGPVLAPLPRLNNLERQHVIIKGRTSQVINAVIKEILAASPQNASVQIAVDVDPLSLM